MNDVTPMMQQYQAIKAECPGAILFFRLGDFYEMFGADAVEASKILEITLTSRNKKDEHPVPMCGVPYHAAENYINRLIKAGKKVAICEQISDPALPGIVKRKIVRTVTPGTVTSEQILQEKRNRFVLSLFSKKDYFGLAYCDLSTGEFQTEEIQGEENLKNELLRIAPVEVVLNQEQYEESELRARLARLMTVPLSSTEFFEDAYTFLTRSLKVTTLEIYGIANWPFAIQASALLMRYLVETQKDRLPHVDRIQAYHRDAYMPLDEATIRNLELFSSLRAQEKEGTLLSILDETQTSMGGRLLRRWLSQALKNKPHIEARHKAVETLVQDDDLRYRLRENLSLLSDFERLLGRLSGPGASARDLVGLASSLERIPIIKSILASVPSSLLQSLQNGLDPLEDLVRLIQRSILPEPNLRLTEGGLIQSGFHPELDELHALMKDAKAALKAIEKAEIQTTGIGSLKVGFNRVFGYYLEVSTANVAKVPDHYIRKQTLSNAERFITPELKNYEEKVLTAEDRAKTLEYEIFMGIRDQVLQHIKEIKSNAALLAEMDVLLSFAQTALKRYYCKPFLLSERDQDGGFEIKRGRHPVVESMSVEQSFVANDSFFLREKNEILLITGPNMSGKSTYLRQVALIVLMAQIGSFVPAESVRMPVFDRIFTRVGASDNLVRGQSTFMVEMQETAYILHNASPQSLIILDEIGRGTSTYDGLSLAWAIFEYLHDHLRATTLFATHYHELMELADRLPRAKNYSIDVQETEKGVLFLHQIKEGGIDKSYGIEVARLAGLPDRLIDRATSILENLEAEKVLHSKKIPENQLDLFARPHASLREPGKMTHPALEKLKKLDIDRITPLEALNALSELKQIKP